MKKEEFLAMSLKEGLKCCLMGEWTKETENDENPTPKICLVGGIEYQSYAENKLEIECTDDDYIYNVPLEEVFPICRPLSDLTKQIEHNGEKFVPIERILGLGKKNGDTSNHLNYKILINDNYLIRVELVRSQQTIELNFRDLSLKHAMILIEWHFDLFGGIDSGDAIDVNSLHENPYK